MKPDVMSVALPDASARIMRDMLNGQNVGWNSFCARSRIAPLRLDGCSTVILAQEELRLQSSFAETTRERPALWFDTGLRYRSVSYGTYGLAMMTSPRLGEALDVAVRFQALSYSLMNYSCEALADGSIVLTGDDSDVPADLRIFTQYRDLAAMRTLIADLTGGQLPVQRITVAAPQPDGWADRQHLFPCPVQFGAPETRWHFGKGAAAQHLQLADASLAAHYAARCQRRLRRLQSRTPVSDRLSSMIMIAPQRYTSLRQAADSLGMSERTLHRRLADEGRRFSALLDDARFRRARALLADKSRTVEEIAFAVGFAEPSSFSRAFRRWSGMGSTEYRRRLGYSVGDDLQAAS